MVLIEIFLINVTTKVCKRTEMPKCKKRKLFGMSQQCRTPSKVAHIIRTLSPGFLVLGGSVQPPFRQTAPGYRTPLDAGHVNCVPTGKLPPNGGQTNTCENITLPQTSFASGKYCFALESPKQINLF